jgi:MoaA/NifB/PqqE/SkfB family radical SAM enzyme
MIGEKRTPKYAQDALLEDGSVDWTGVDKPACMASLASEETFARLKHPEVRYEVTDHCNAACIMCPREQHEKGREHGIMDLEKYKKSIDEVVALGCKKIVLTGFGEPLVDKTLEDKIRYAKTKGLNTYIISNASILDEKRCRSLIESGLDEMRVSFYGMTKKSYETVMRKLNFEKTWAGLHMLLDLRAKLGSKKPKIEISWLMMEENKEDTDAFKAYWEPKIDAIEIWKPHNFGDGRSYRDRHTDPSLKRTCGRPENGPLQIQWNGEVIPCCYDYNNQIILGNAFEEPVMDILNGSKYKLLRKAHRDGEFGLFPYCNQCDQLLPHADALVYTNRHKLPPEIAVRMSNTDLYDLEGDKEFDPKDFRERYADGLVQKP